MATMRARRRLPSTIVWMGWPATFERLHGALLNARGLWRGGALHEEWLQLQGHLGRHRCAFLCMPEAHRTEGASLGKSRWQVQGQIPEDGFHDAPILVAPRMQSSVGVVTGRQTADVTWLVIHHPALHPTLLLLRSASWTSRQCTLDLVERFLGHCATGKTPAPSVSIDLSG